MLFLIFKIFSGILSSGVLAGSSIQFIHKNSSYVPTLNYKHISCTAAASQLYLLYYVTPGARTFPVLVCVSPRWKLVQSVQLSLQIVREILWCMRVRGRSHNVLSNTLPLWSCSGSFLWWENNFLNFSFNRINGCPFTPSSWFVWSWAAFIICSRYWL